MTQVKENVKQESSLVVNKKFMEETVESVLAKINSFQSAGSLNLPSDYSVGNALKSAWLILQEQKTKDSRPVLEACTKESICNALLKMSIEGLSPVKKQCDFIAYGNKLVCQREYHGTIALAKRYAGIQGVVANVIYTKDDFEYSIDPETGRKKIIKHGQAIENIDMSQIRGAYAVVTESDGAKYIEIMSMAQIRKSWEQGSMNGNSGAHKNFTDEMCKKTVINRACKLYISSSDDGSIIDDEPTREDVVKKEIRKEANSGQSLNIQDAVVTEPEQPHVDEQDANIESQPQPEF